MIDCYALDKTQLLEPSVRIQAFIDNEIVNNKRPYLNSDKLLNTYILNASSPFYSKQIDSKAQLPTRATQQILNKISALQTKYDLSENSISVANKILQYINKTIIPEIQVGFSSESELLLYINRNGTYFNIAIDEEGDIEVLHLPIDRSKSHNYYFYTNQMNFLNDAARKFSQLLR